MTIALDDVLGELDTDAREKVELGAERIYRERLSARLRDGERRFLKWAYKDQYSGPPVLSIPRHPDNVDALLVEAADYIDAIHHKKE